MTWCTACSGRPADQLAVAAGPLMRSSGARQWFLVGDDYSWSHGAHRAARQVLPEAGGVIAGGPHHIRQQLRLAEASVGGFRLLDSAS